MLAVFPSSPIHPKKPDSAFEDEVAVAKKVGFEIGFVDLELNFGGDVKLRIPEGSGRAVYRGWIVKPEEYRRLDEALKAEGYTLLNDSVAYQHCHHLPEWYQGVGPELTPRSIWFPSDKLGPYGSVLLAPGNFELGEVADNVHRVFGDKSLILKDYVKSRKHEWYDACFIRSAADTNEVKRVLSNFLRLQGDQLVGGLIFREYVDFKRIGLHSKSRMPLIQEFRFFISNHKILGCFPYWNEGRYEGDLPPASVIEPLLPKIQSCFFTADVAQKEDGSWLVVELGDGGASGVPDGSDPVVMYQGLLDSV